MTYRIQITPVPVAMIALLAALLIPATCSAAEYYVPPSNSAVNQYSESFPTAGGERGDSERGSVRKKSRVAAVGAENVRKLDQRGPDGAATAEVVAATSPTPVAPEAEDLADSPRSAADSRQDDRVEPAAAGDDDRGSGGRGTPAPADGAPWLETVAPRAVGLGPSDGLGALFPLLLLAATGWAASQAIRLYRRRPN